MSGGSFDYLCFNTEDLSRRASSVEAMARRLERTPSATQAAADTRRVLALLADAQALAERLADVWHAVEWCVSGDTGEDDVQDALAKYRALPRTAVAAPEGSAPSALPTSWGGLNGVEIRQALEGAAALKRLGAGYGL